MTPEEFRRAGHELVDWIHTAMLHLLAPSWRHRSDADKRRFVDQYVVRSLLVPREVG